MKLKNIILKNNRGNSPSYEENDLNKNNPIINQSCVQKDFINFDKLKYNKKTSKGAKGHLIKGDILICSTGGGTVGRVGYWNYDFDNYIADSHVTVLRINNKNNSRFVYYYLSSVIGAEFIRTCIKGATNQEELSNKALNNFILNVPDIITQHKISSFLDAQCGKIDTEISLLKKKSILLDEYKNSLIFETVTKGLDKNAVMKDSGIDWIGEIPEHWKVKRLKDKLLIKKGDVFTENLNNEYGKYPYINGGINPSGWTNITNCKEYTIAVSEGGASSGYSQFIENKFWAGTHCYKIVPHKNKHYYNKYYYYLLKGFEKQIQAAKTGSAMPNLQKSKFINLFFPFASILKEQISLVDFLDNETKKIENQIELINKKIELLKEYKQSLIYEAVTGQLEIE